MFQTTIDPTDTTAALTLTHVTITARAAASEVEVFIEHSPDNTRDEFGQPVVVKSRTFRRRVACPVAAAHEMARRTYLEWPSCKVELVNA